MKDNVVLIGMPGAGKSTVGVVLAKTLGYDYVDTDILISKSSGKSLQRLLDEVGLRGFLAMEEEVGAGLHCSRTVIATGGSMVFSEKAMRHLSEIGEVFYLEVPLEELRRRIKNITTRGIAFAPGETLEALFEKREPLYRQYADQVIPSNKDLENAVNAIAQRLSEENMS